MRLAERAAGSWDGVRALLGGKGANLAEMTKLKLPVPPGFVVTTQACNAFLAAGGRFPKGMWEQVLKAVDALERATGKRFADPGNPLLVSCRSGAKFSMPGMMDTVLNIGLNDRVAEGLVRLTGDERFVFDAYRRLVQMYATVVLDVPDKPFEELLSEYRSRRSVWNDADLPAEDLKAITEGFKRIVQEQAHRAFPMNALEQLKLATMAVFRSWNGKRAQDYRNAAGIPHDLGTAVNVVAMVFGNQGADSGTGVATTRDVTTGENKLDGDFLMNAQGEDVVAGTRTTLHIEELARLMPRVDKQLRRIGRTLEKHYRDVQDIEFTIERGKLWMLQTRDAKRTAQAAIRLAVELAKERLVSKAEAVRRVTPEHIDYFLHPQLDAAARSAAKEEGTLIAEGLNVSPGAAIGQIVFDADVAEHWAQKLKKKVILVRPETRPDDVHGMLAAQGVLTSHGGRTSHAALVARQFGIPAVVGVVSLEVDVQRRQMRTSTGKVLKEGDWLSIDGGTGEVYAGELATVVPDVTDPYFVELLSWADGFRRLGVWANADYARDAERARKFGAAGIGLCRTEHMFFEAERLPVVQSMILARSTEQRAQHLAKLLPMQRGDFVGLFKAMDGLPVTIRLIDPPLHEFLPSHDELQKAIVELETRLRLSDGDPEALEAELRAKRKVLDSVEAMREQNPMLGLRGVRLGIHMPELVRMQMRAILEAACECVREGVKVKPKIMIPLVSTSAELQLQRALLEEEAQKVLKEQGMKVPYQFGTMIEVPRAALIADRIAEFAEFFSFGTNDLTQTTFAISRDDAETGFLSEYMQKGILTRNPFATIDQEGVGYLMELGVKLGRQTRKKLEVGICGEHGGDPASIAFCHRLGLDYVSCSPFRVPVARLAAAHAALGELKDQR
ncbi:MAG: pyruvate, phosphate dikinase [Betaproteobacteria bacterium RIFCSPLOWO2_02_FULL_65_24]|nr:MAG: pyruvate, phosphate dikinase [Betaproteobacteria bacterium RIFCSPLOWO2_02_FULL_65_24]